jgi:hypothetical protein
MMDWHSFAEGVYIYTYAFQCFLRLNLNDRHQAVVRLLQILSN